MNHEIRPMPRRLARPLLALSLCALSLVFATNAAAAAPANFVGLQTWGPPSAADLGKLRRAGVTEYRMVVNWSSVESTRARCHRRQSCHTYSWKRFDPIFDMAARRGIRILPVLMDTPSWAGSARHWPPNSTLGRGSFYDYAAAVTRRYGANGSFWKNRPYRVRARVKARFLQIWNEPNLGNYWNGRPSAGGYANLLRGASKSAKAADPATRIVAAGLPWSKGPTPETFLEGMFTWNKGALKRYVDAVAVHPYDRTPAGMAGKVRSTRLKLNSLGVRPALWITEMGWASGKPDNRFQVSTRQQAANLKAAYDRLISARRAWDLDRAYWFSLRDKGESGWSHKTGLFYSNWRVKPSWRALLGVTGKG